MTILVTGANGQLGNEMRIVAEGLSHDFLFTDVSQQDGVETTCLDITNMDDIRKVVNEHHIDVIINCAAWTNVDACETDPKLAALAEKLNAEAPANLALAMKEVDGLLIHISTDYVFGKEPYNVPCNPDQKGTPTGVYGTTKLHGEQNIISSGCKYVIIRTAWLYSEFGKNFCKTMLALTATKPQLKVVFDQCGTPTYALDLANAVVTILEDYQKELVNCQLSTVNYTKSGIYHFSNEGVCSWYDFTKMIQQIAVQIGYYDNLPNDGDTGCLCDVQPCHSDEFPSPVKRPAYSVLDKTSIKETFGVTVAYWIDSLRKCITNFQKQLESANC